MAGTALHGRLTWQTAAVTSVTRETSSVCTIGLDLPDWPGHRAGQHVDVRLTAEDGYPAERECSIASAPGEPLAITVERWWGLEATAYLYIAFVAVLSVIAAVHAGCPQAHQRTHDGRSATSAAGSLHHARHEPTPTTTPYRRAFLKGFEHASDHRTGP